MVTARKRKRLATFIDEKCEEQPRSNLAPFTIVPRSQEDYITQISEEIEDSLRMKLSNEFNRMQSRISGALSQLDDFPLNPLIQSHSASVLETSRNALGTNHGTKRTTPRVIFVLKQASLRDRLCKNPAQMMVTIGDRRSKWRNKVMAVILSCINQNGS